MKKFCTLFILLSVFPIAHAGFVSSSITIESENPDAVPLGKTVTSNANITFSWGVGAIIPIPITITLEVLDVPSWLSVSLSRNEFPVTPSGLMGGQTSQNIQLSFRADAEIDAFEEHSLTLHASTTGNFIIKSTESSSAIYVMEDYVDNGLIIEALESIPEANVAFRIGDYYIETLKTKGNVVKTAQVTEIPNPGTKEAGH